MNFRWMDHPFTVVDGRHSGSSLPACTLPGAVRSRPGHMPSSVTFCVRLPDARLTMSGGRRARWKTVTRVECECGWATGRTRPDVSAPSRDDIAVRAMHSSHALKFPRKNAA